MIPPRKHRFIVPTVREFTFTFRMTDLEFERLHLLAKTHNISASVLLRQLLTEEWEKGT